MKSSQQKIVQKTVQVRSRSRGPPFFSFLEEGKGAPGPGSNLNQKPFPTHFIKTGDKDSVNVHTRVKTYVKGERFYINHLNFLSIKIFVSQCAELIKFSTLAL